MKVLLFAHTPPPHHGQSHMVQQLLNALGGDARCRPGANNAGVPAGVQCHHVNARFSADAADIGRRRPGKLWLLLKYCGQAVGFGWRYQARCLFYVPAPAQPAAVIRDWLVMLLCRPFFSRRVYWWQAAGLGEWLASSAPPWQRWLTRQLLGQPDLSIVLTEWGRRDAAAVSSKRTLVVPNGIADPCPEFATTLLPRLAARAACRRQLLAGGSIGATERSAAGPDPDRYRLLFLSLCTREKGLFDALEAVALANRRLAEARSPLRVELAVAGAFRDPAEQAEFNRRCAVPDLCASDGKPSVHYVGFVTGETKAKLLRESDGLCFPTFYSAEGFPVVLIEAMAWGLQVITTRWRGIPELLPEGFESLVQTQSPEAIAEAIGRQMTRSVSVELREHFLKRFTAEHCFNSIKQALIELEHP